MTYSDLEGQRNFQRHGASRGSPRQLNFLYKTVGAQNVRRLFGPAICTTMMLSMINSRSSVNLTMHMLGLSGEFIMIREPIYISVVFL